MCASRLQNALKALDDAIGEVSAALEEMKAGRDPLGKTRVGLVDGISLPVRPAKIRLHARFR